MDNQGGSSSQNPLTQQQQVIPEKKNIPSGNLNLPDRVSTDDLSLVAEQFEQPNQEDASSGPELSTQVSMTSVKTQGESAPTENKDLLPGEKEQLIKQEEPQDISITNTGNLERVQQGQVINITSANEEIKLPNQEETQPTGNEITQPDLQEAKVTDESSMSVQPEGQKPPFEQNILQPVVDVNNKTNINIQPQEQASSAPVTENPATESLRQDNKSTITEATIQQPYSQPEETSPIASVNPVIIGPRHIEIIKEAPKKQPQEILEKKSEPPVEQSKTESEVKTIATTQDLNDKQPLRVAEPKIGSAPMVTESSVKQTPQSVASSSEAQKPQLNFKEMLEAIKKSNQAGGLLVTPQMDAIRQEIYQQESEM